MVRKLSLLVSLSHTHTQIFYKDVWLKVRQVRYYKEAFQKLRNADTKGTKA